MSRMSELHAELAAQDATARDAASEMLSALLGARAWVLHWQMDKAHGLAPTDGSLEDALREIETAITNAGGRWA
jgi:hypothetical protein